MSDINLHDTTDAAVWASEFRKRFPSALCQIEGKEGVTDGDDFEGAMIVWFANAIMAGVDSEARKHAEGTAPTVLGYRGQNAVAVTMIMSDGSEVIFDPDQFNNASA